MAFCIIALVAVTALAAASPLPQQQDNIFLNTNFEHELSNLPLLVQQKVQARLENLHISDVDAHMYHVDNKGHIYVVDEIPAVNRRSLDELAKQSFEERHARSLVEVAPDRYDSRGLPIFHSKPGASNKIFLDFDGHVHPGNEGWSAFTAKPFDPSGNDSPAMSPTFTSAEKTAITLIWQRIAEDFAPFNVDVTTEEPTFTNKVCHCLITHTSAHSGSMPAKDAGGVAYVDIFGSSYNPAYSPALVYYNNLGSQEDYIAEAASHGKFTQLGASTLTLNLIITVFNFQYSYDAHYFVSTCRNRSQHGIEPRRYF
jgi:hypothetical protein